MKLKKSMMVLALAGAALVSAGAVWAEECEEAAHANDYPTYTRGDYIYGCMMVNGQGRDVLDKCACSIDVIASVLPYKEYEEAETVLSVRQRGGENVAFLFTPAMREKVNNLKRAQIEGELRCF
jgi:hypothetical protein